MALVRVLGAGVRSARGGARPSWDRKRNLEAPSHCGIGGSNQERN